MAIGMYFHHFPRPHPPKPAFSVRIPSRLSKRRGHFKLIFYVPDEYHDFGEGSSERRFPVVVNYHGGGFTLGTGKDDARWARAVVETTGAVFVSVEYRLAPKHPFSVGVEDCADAVIYLAAHADELRLDANRMALSGFSAGANYALTAPLLLHDLQMDNGIRSLQQDSLGTRPSSIHSISNTFRTRNSPGQLSRQSSHDSSDQNKSTSTLNLPLKPLVPTELEIAQILPDFNLRTIVSFYPPTDFRITREEKKATNPKPEYNLPPLLTNLFDESYLSAEHTTCKLDFSDPYLSPMAASDDLLRDAYPQSMILYTCEYDMLNAEGVAFGERLKAAPISKTVKGGLIHGVPHAFDKKPNPVRFPKSADRCYQEACAEINEVFGRRESWEERRQLSKSKDVERFEEAPEGGIVTKGVDEDKESYRKRQSVSESRRRSSVMGDIDNDAAEGSNSNQARLAVLREVSNTQAINKGNENAVI